MPRLLAERIVTLEFADLYRRVPIVRPERPPERSPGAHQSDILAYIARKIGVLKPGEKLEEEYPWRMAMGNMFEEFYFSMLPYSIWQPGEQIVDGIAVNCDGLGHLDEGLSLVMTGLTGVVEPCLDETKCTEKKIRSGEDFLGEWMWMHQGREYCYCYGPRVVRWAIFYYRGDWRGSGPVCVEYTVAFSDSEVEQTHEMLLLNKDDAMAALAA